MIRTALATTGVAPDAMKTRRRALVAAAVTAVVAAVAVVIAVSLGGAAQNRRLSSKGGSAGTTQTAVPHRDKATSDTRPLAESLGQMIVARFTGPRPSESFLARIRAGEVGGVILFSDNVSGGLTAARALTAELQHAAREGNQPPLLIMTDQEGGEVKRLPGPPTLSPATMTSSAVAFAQGQATGRLLRSVGINVDLAPVADVERVPGSFLGTRSFGSNPATVAQRACAFARGLASAQVAYTLKHFPGLGRATGNTDLGSVTVDAPAAELRADYQAYRTCAANPLALIMVSSAIYPAVSGPLPAVMSSAIYHRELPLATNGARNVIISDDLQAPAITREPAPARRSITAGLDLAMYAQTEQASAAAYTTLLQEAKSGVLSTSRIDEAARAVVTLKHHLAP